MFAREPSGVEAACFHAFTEAAATALRTQPNPLLAAPVIAERLRRLSLRQRWLPARIAEEPRSHHVLHVSDDGAFSVVAFVLEPGAATPIHDHDAWCVTNVYEGTVEEQRFLRRSDSRGVHLVETSTRVLAENDLAIALDPDAVHRISNRSSARAVSIHVYGTDVGEKRPLRATYDDLPIV